MNTYENQNPNQTNPDRILQTMYGHWYAATLSTALTHSVFTQIEGGEWTCDEIAKRCDLSPRGTQALLDGLYGLGLVWLRGGRYSNTTEASCYLVEGKTTYIGDMGKYMLTGPGGSFTQWMNLPEAVKTGCPVDEGHGPHSENAEYWEKLVTAFAPLSAPIAEAACKRLGIARAGAVSWVDVGGGSGIYSAIWLKANPRANAVQVDWPNVNRIAFEYANKFGVGERFRTIDGDYHLVDYGDCCYDYVIWSQIAHHETPQENVAMFRKFRAALRPGGTFVICDFVLNDDRTGHPFALLFNQNMLLHSKGGNCWRQCDYRTWLSEAGFREVNIEATQTPLTLIYAR